MHGSGLLLAVGACALAACGEQVVRDGAPAWSPDGKQIAFYSEQDGNSEIYVMNADGSGRRRITNHPASDGYPQWSPDGEKILFDSDRDRASGGYDIYVMNADGSDVVRLTSHPKQDLSASWSPDGSTIAFMSDRGTISRPNSVRNFRIWLMDADGSNPRLLTTETDQDYFPQWSRDGEKIAFHYGRDVHVINADGTGLRRLTTEPIDGMYPSWSPDGSRIAFMSSRDGGSDEFMEIFTMNADGTGLTRVTETLMGAVIDPRWSPDGSKIVYVYLPNGQTDLTGPRLIHVMDADGGNPTLLSSAGG